MIIIIIMIVIKFNLIRFLLPQLSAENEIEKVRQILLLEADEIGHLGWLRYVSHFGAGLP